VTDVFASVTEDELKNGFVLQKGKKNFYKGSVDA
jgi:hypothetical protein